MDETVGRGPGPSAHGFTLVEIVVVIAIAAILISMAVKGFGSATSQLAVQGARQSFQELEARARSYAIEHGDLTRFRVDPDGDSIWVESSSGRIEIAKIGDERNVDIQSSTSGVTTLCLNPRGFGEPDCDSFTSSVEFKFVQGARETSATLLPLGQIR